VTNKNGEFAITPETQEKIDEIRVRVRLLDGKKHEILTTGILNAAKGRDTYCEIAASGIEHGVDWQDIRYINGQPVNLRSAAMLTREDLIQAYLYHRGRLKKVRKTNLVQRAFPTLFRRRARGDDCGEGLGEPIRLLLEERGGANALNEGDADDLPPSAAVSWFYTNNIQVKYTTDAGFPNDRVDPTLPAADQQLTLSDGTAIGWIRQNLADLHSDNTQVAPIYVQKVGLIAEHALSRFISPAFAMRDPRNGAARFEYRIFQMPAGIAGQTNGSWSHVEVGPNNSDLQNLHTVPHEMFHQVQYRYNNTTTRSGIYGALREGGARLIEDSINDQPNRYVDTAAAMLNDPTQSLADSPSVGTSVGASTPIRYAAGLFWKYVAEQHSTRTTAADEPAIGLDSYRKALEATATVLAGDPGVGYDPTTLRAARGNMPWYGSFDQFRFYDAPRTELDSHENTWGNFLIANFLHGTANPVGDSRFEYMEDEAPVNWPGSGVAKLANLQAQIVAANNLTFAQGASIGRSATGQLAWSARYYRLTPSGTPGPRMLQITFNSSGGMTDPLVQILRLGPGSTLIDVHRSDSASYSKTLNFSGLSQIIVIVASRATPGDFTIQFDEVAAASDVMVTRWNSAVGTEYEVNPRGWAWTWVSPDVMVDNNNDGLADTTVFFGQDNALKVRLRNRGNQMVNNIQIDFWYQKATPFLSAAGWTLVQNAAAVTQQITGGSLAAGADNWFTVQWAPVDDGTHHPHWCVKVKVTVAGDPNSDNKMALSNFANVQVPPDPDRGMFKLLQRLPQEYRRAQLIPIARGPRWTFAPIEPVETTKVSPINHYHCHSEITVPSPNSAKLIDVKPTRKKLLIRDSADRSSMPHADQYYPVDPKSLPPGVNPDLLVTLAMFVDDGIIGGVTYSIDIKSDKLD
jgi:hypothetical protein